MFTCDKSSLEISIFLNFFYMTFRTWNYIIRWKLGKANHVTGNLFIINRTRIISLYLKFRYHAQSSVERACSISGTKHRSELKLSRHLPNCSMSDLSPGHLSSFFSFSFFSASRKLAREEPNKGLWKCQTP